MVLGVGLIYAKLPPVLCVGDWAKKIPALCAAIGANMFPSFLKNALTARNSNKIRLPITFIENAFTARVYPK